MQLIQPDLWETEPDFPAAGLSTHAYLWTPKGGGNVLFYNTMHEQEFDRIAELGGLDRQYLSHKDEISPSLRRIRERFGAKLCLHHADADAALPDAPVDVAFSERHVDHHGIEVIPTPGHTPGSTCFLVPSTEGLTYLFTGDSVYLNDQGVWSAGHIPGYSDRDALAASLALLADLLPDIVITSAYVGATSVHQLDRPWRDCVNEALRSLEG